MDPVTIGAIITGVGALTSIFGGMSAKKAANSAAGKQAEADLKVTQEKVYQLGQEERQLAGSTRAAVASSGVKADKGSPLTVLAEQAKTFAREKMVTSQVGAKNAALTRQRGSMVGQQAAFGGFAQGFQGLGSAFSMYG